MCVAIRTVLPLLAALVLLCAPLHLARAGVYRVGPGCQYPDLAAAFAVTSGDLSAEYRLSGDQAMQQLVIQGRDVTIEGGYANCDAPTPSGVNTLNGSGGARTSVITIRGHSEVRLSRLWVAFGDDTDSDDNGGDGGGHGGGVDFRGSGSLRLDEVSVLLNEADYGGGIHAYGSGALALTIGAGTRIYSNTASVSGGGLRLEGKVDLRMTEPDSGIFGNLADTGYGGGLLALGAVEANIGSPGVIIGGTRHGAIYDNVAEYGGGIAIASRGDEEARVRLFATSAEHPVRLEGNRARAAGGAIWLEPNGDFYSGRIAAVCLYDFRLDHNSAREGAAIYADTDSTLGFPQSSVVLMNQHGRCGGLPSELNAVRCRPGARCNAIDGNRARDANDVATGGAVVLLQTGAELSSTRTQWYDNRGGALVRSVEADVVSFDGCVMAGNTATGSLIRSEGGARIDLARCTIADNGVAGSAVVVGDGGVRAIESILHTSPPEMPLLGGSGTREVVHVLASERLSLDGGSTPYVRTGAPRFVDPAHFDLRLQVASPAIDAAPVGGGSGQDADLHARDQDLPQISYGTGPRDLGAYERQAIGNLVLNPEFPVREDADELRLWSASGANTTIAWSGTEGDGSTPGSVLVSYDPANPPIGTRGVEGSVHYFGLRQCVHLPFAGAYALSAATKMPGNFNSQDYARLRWTLRTDDANCSGAATRQGEALLARSTGWSTAAPTTIVLDPPEWTSNSTLEIVMMLEPNPNGASTNVISGYFDRVTLMPTGLPPPTGPLFRDGFEN